MTEQIYCTKKEARQYPRLSAQIQIQCRAYSVLLQRAMVDFGADDSFEKASEKLKEHYGIEVSSTAVRRQTYRHGVQMGQRGEHHRELPKQGQAASVISESDGTMIPLVAIQSGKGDGRKRRTVFWKEAISSLAYRQGSILCGTRRRMAE